MCGTTSSTFCRSLVDGQNRRVAKKKNGAFVKKWLYRDQLHPVVELDGAGNLSSRFIYATGRNSPDVMIQAGVQYRILTDQLGSPRVIANAATGAVVQRMRHDEFGIVLEDTNPGFTPFGFAGGLYDVDTGLVRFGARDYDPAVGRWISKDPALFGGQQTNLYTYLHNDPVNFVDRTGRQAIPISPWAAIIAGAEAGALVGSAFDGVGAIPGAIFGALFAAASVPGDSVCEIRGEGKWLDRISRDQGIPRDVLRKALETIKKKNGLRGSENVDILPDGTVIDPVSGDEIGNIHHE